MNTVSTKSRDTFEYSKYKVKRHITIQYGLRAETHLNSVSTKIRDTFEFSKY